MGNIHNKNKSLFNKFQKSLYDYDQEKLSEIITTLFAPDAILQMCFPFETLAHPDELLPNFINP